MIKLLLIAALFLTSCATTPKPVYVPVQANCPAIKLDPEPHYPLYDLQDNDTVGKVAKACVSSLVMCIGDDRKIRRQINNE